MAEHERRKNPHFVQEEFQQKKKKKRRKNQLTRTEDITIDPSSFQFHPITVFLETCLVHFETKLYTFRWA